MAKQKKKRTKKYSGVDAAQRTPSITRVEAVSRNRVSQWWFDHKKIAKPVLITAAVVLAIVVLLIELVRLIVNA